ncbi:hypothetical protein [Pseudomonas marginalis]|uniref:hypothetical protein n=1 Tax=Pseudomonas marginalis TaxID=298 RepID=UPI0011B3EF1B|nr:hypothetical protein [Pseudomonas marginalis]KAA8552166.1 hypothetical protein FX984_04677 [Pseudomonas marginalis]TWR74116.1 hypothetical protein FIV40_01775 [Pseudomonas marginalis]
MLKQPDSVELQARIESAQAGYRDRKSGLDMNAGTDPVTGRAVPKQVDGGTVVFFCPHPLDILPTYLEQVHKGYQIHPLSVVQIDHSRFDIYFFKPESDIKAALEQIAQDVTVQYYAEVEQHNELFIQAQVDAQLKVDRAREERDLAKAEAERRAAVEKQIRETFKPTEAAPVPAPTKGKRS